MVHKLTHAITLPGRLLLRSQSIAYTLYRHGLAGSLRSIGLELGRRGLTFSGVVKVAPQSFDRVFGKSLASTCVKLGPTFVKLGQLLATRPDLVGEDVSDELRVLFDKVPSIPLRKIEKILENELGKKKLKQAVLWIDPKPLGSASLAQTHRATLKNGKPVILKVQKEGVADLVRLDLQLLSGLAFSVNAVYPKLGMLQMFRDFEQATLREIDYREEAKNIDRFRKNYAKLFSGSDVLFPSYDPDLLTEKVMALEPMQGKKVSDLKKGTTVARKAAELSLAAVLEQIFDHGFFHADPHAGNLFFLEEEGRVGFIDLGLVGQLESKDKQLFLKVILAILKRDRKRLSESLYQLGTKTKKADFKKFDEGIQEILEHIKRQGVDNVRLDKMVNQLLVVARKNGVIVPNRYVLMIRSCLMIEGVAKGLDPKLSLFQVAVPIVTKSLFKSYNPFRIFRK